MLRHDHDRLSRQHGKTQADTNPMREVAIERGTPVFEPESINTDEARAALTAWRPDLFVVCDYGQILKPETLAIARLGEDGMLKRYDWLYGWTRDA